MLALSRPASAVRVATISCRFVCLLFLVPASAQQSLPDPSCRLDHRHVTSLNGDWHYLVDQAPGRALYTRTGEINDKTLCH